MNAGAYHEKITIQKKSVSTDNIGQQSESWSDYFTCHAYVNNLSGREFWAAAQQNAEKTVEFITRYCKKLSDVECINYRITFCGNVYDIIFVDNIQYRNKILKLKALMRENE